MKEAVDEGELLAQRFFDVAPDETSLTINTRCYEAAIESFGPLCDALASESGGSALEALRPLDLISKVTGHSPEYVFTTDDEIGFPRPRGDETELLLEWLGYLRGAVIRKIRDLSDEQSRWTPDGWRPSCGRRPGMYGARSNSATRRGWWSRC